MYVLFNCQTSAASVALLLNLVWHCCNYQNTHRFHVYVRVIERAVVVREEVSYGVQPNSSGEPRKAVLGTSGVRDATLLSGV